MRYVDTNTLAILTLGDIKELYPTTSFPGDTPDLTDFGYSQLFEVSPPSYNHLTEILNESVPELNEIDSRWYQTWDIVELSPSMAAANQAIANITLRAAIVRDVMQRLDDFAATRNYSNIFSACTYATSTIPKFQEEAIACVQLRDQTWMACYEILADVEANIRPMPTGYADIADELPVLVWMPSVAFSADVTTGPAPLTVTFTNESVGGVSYQWDFDNNGNIDSISEDATYAYINPGTYSVRLVVTNQAGNKQIIKTNYIVAT